jgi:hypothetical protein
VQYHHTSLVGLNTVTSFLCLYSLQPFDHPDTTVLMRFSSAATVLAALASTATASTSFSLSNARTDLKYTKILADKIAEKPESTLKPASLPDPPRHASHALTNIGQHRSVAQTMRFAFRPSNSGSKGRWQGECKCGSPTCRSFLLANSVVTSRVQDYARLRYGRQ